MMRWIWLTMLWLLQRLCKHPPEHVSADITEGNSHKPLQWCRACGAYRYGGIAPGSWYGPIPHWLRGKGERP